MRHIQGKRTLGYAIVLIKGPHIEAFLQELINKHIPLWDIKRADDYTCEVKLYLHDLNELHHIKEAFDNKYEIKEVSEKGLFTFIRHFWRKKQLLIALLFSLATLYLLSNVVWSINMSGLSHETEEKLRTQLAVYGISKGSFTFSQKPLQTIQQDILNDIPELLWIGIEQKGTSFHIKGVEKKSVQDEEERHPRHLIAKKNGIIKKIFVQKGKPVVNKHDYVREGDLLVSGLIEHGNQIQTEDDEEEELNLEQIHAVGDVYANTWYKLNISVPLELKASHLTGEHYVTRQLKIGQTEIPLNPFKKNQYTLSYDDKKSRSFTLFKWKLPFELVKTHTYELEQDYEAESKEEVIKKSIELAKEQLLLDIGKDAEILSEFILHEAIDSGKVNIQLFMSVLENIAIEQHITIPKNDLNNEGA